MNESRKVIRRTEASRKFTKTVNQFGIIAELNVKGARSAIKYSKDFEPVQYVIQVNGNQKEGTDVENIERIEKIMAEYIEFKEITNK